jgi:hypothetical protein
VLRETVGEQLSNQTAVSEWHSCFKAGRVSVEDERSGRPTVFKTTENVEKIPAFLHEDCYRTIHELAETAGISYGDCQEILTKK